MEQANLRSIAYDQCVPSGLRLWDDVERRALVTIGDGLTKFSPIGSAHGSPTLQLILLNFQTMDRKRQCFEGKYLKMPREMAKK